MWGVGVEVSSEQRTRGLEIWGTGSNANHLTFGIVLGQNHAVVNHARSGSHDENRRYREYQTPYGAGVGACSGARDVGG